MSNLSTETLTEIVNEIRDDIKSILAQTTRTNGRVRVLEVWRGYITGGLTILGVLVGYLLSIIK